MMYRQKSLYIFVSQSPSLRGNHCYYGLVFFYIYSRKIYKAGIFNTNGRLLCEVLYILLFSFDIPWRAFHISIFFLTAIKYSIVWQYQKSLN